MHINLDIRHLQKASRYRGIGTYLECLTKSLALIDSENKYTYLSLSHGEPLELKERFNDRWIECPLYRPRKPERLHWVWDRIFLHKVLNSNGADIFHASDLTSVPFLYARRKYKIVVTVHDMIPFKFWDFYSEDYPFDYKFALKKALKKLREVDIIIADSEATKKDILELIEIPQESVKVIYLGVRQDFGCMARLEAKDIVKTEHGINGNYVLYLGGADYRKNVRNIILSFGLLLKKYDVDLKLVLAGEVFERKHLKEIKEIDKFIIKLGLEKRIDKPGVVDDEHLNALYSAAELFVFPSLYEGFGLPVLEAMACGVPVVTSNVSSLPEVAGDAAYFVDPQNVKEIADGMYNVLTDTELRRNMRMKGVERAKMFTWEKTAEETLAVYKGVYNNEAK